ncbi:hypothetical protein JTE90_010822 [Oedothorax gibbosus]|uniref:CUE domain-containing protein n=1 Tax=Oedothorax gibbosus TaxID=931172 RepID=A0AAV6V4K3_9ARAC|nr:hypothetical protein JTE90_010822 [Oedothorax gibbosus]
MSEHDSPEKNQDAFVKSELSRFIMEHTGSDTLSSIDEIVLSYIIGVLESLGSADVPEDVFDVDEFAEMMTAYIPAFSNIHSYHTYAWMLNLAGCLKEISQKNKNCFSESFLFKVHERQRCVSESSTQSIDSESQTHSRTRRKSYHSSTSYSSSQSEDDEKCITVDNFGHDEIETLTEMFPHLHIVEVKQFLSMSDGDCEKAVQFILQRQESNLDLNEPVNLKGAVPTLLTASKEKVVEDKELRKQILKRYAYIDQDEDEREHKPVAPKTEPKKLIRYRDNKIVSIKGERYVEMKKLEDSDISK